MILNANKIGKNRKREKLKSKELETDKDKEIGKEKGKGKDKSKNNYKNKKINRLKNRNKKWMRNILVVEIINKGGEIEVIVIRKRKIKIKIDKDQETKNIKDKNKTGIRKEMINTMMTGMIKNKKRNTRKIVPNLVLKIDTLKGKETEETIDALMLFYIKSARIMIIHIAILCKIIIGHEEKSLIRNQK